MASDWPTLTEVKDYLGVGTASEDTQIGFLRVAAVDWIESYTGRAFWGATSGEQTAYYYARPPWVTPENRRVLRLFRDLNDANPTVTNGDGTSLTFSGADPEVLLYPTERGIGPWYELHLSSRKANFWTDVDAPIKIVGYLDHLGMPGPIFLACLKLCQHWYQGMHGGAGGANVVASRQTGLVVAPGEIPDEIYGMVEGYRRA